MDWLTRPDWLSRPDWLTRRARLRRLALRWHLRQVNLRRRARRTRQGWPMPRPSGRPMAKDRQCCSAEAEPKVEA